MGTISPAVVTTDPEFGSAAAAAGSPATKKPRLTFLFKTHRRSSPPSSTMSSAIKTIVSKKKRRFIADGFNLDLSYIVNNRIIAMGFPAENVESLYRNSLEEVKRFLEEKHRDHYMIYNLCSERSYDYKKFAGRVRTYPFDDHHPPNFSTIRPFCEDVQAWLDEDDENVAVVHCKAGKGRTGTMICCYLLHQQSVAAERRRSGGSGGGGGRVPDADSPTWESAEQVLEYYGNQRTVDKKGVTIPSQRRYINYYSSVIRNSLEYKPVKLYLTSIVLDPVPNFFSQFYIQFRVEQSRKELAYVSPDYLAKGGVRQKEFKIWPPLLIVGDVKIEFSYKLNMDMVGLNPKHMKPNKAFHYWFNSFFVDSAFSSQMCHEVKRCHASNSLSEESGEDAASAAAAAANNGNGALAASGNGHVGGRSRFILGGDATANGGAPLTRPLSHTPGVRWSTEETTAHFDAAGTVITSAGGKRHVSSEGGVHSHAKGGSEDSGDVEVSNLLKESSISADMLSPSSGPHHHHHHHHPPLGHAHSGSGGGGSGGGLSSASSSTSSSASTSLAALQQSFTFNDHRKRHTSVPQTSAARLNHAHHQHTSSPSDRSGSGHPHLVSSGSSSSSEGTTKSLNQNASSPANLSDKSELPRGSHVSLMLRKPQIDKANKDKKSAKYSEDFKVTMFLIKAEDQSDAADFVDAPSCPAVVTPGRPNNLSHNSSDSGMTFKSLLAKSGERKSASRTLSGAHILTSVTSTTSTSSTASAKNSSESSDDEDEDDTTDSEAPTQHRGTQSHANLGLAKSGSSVYPNRNVFAQQVSGDYGRQHRQRQQPPAYQSDWI